MHLAGLDGWEPGSARPGSEADVQNETRLLASKLGMRLWRNNVGAYTTDTGSQVRYGLSNDSAKMNAVVKSSDLIGIREVRITPDMVGTSIGQFVAAECKERKWKYSGKPREVAQMKFITLVLSMGGAGGFISDENQLGVL
jgi:hypothetical protein